jgi:predicted AlkP superfamily phosphohydrolase/phosphomutase
VTARVLVVGLDAADPRLMCELACNGDLANTAALLETNPGQRVINPDGLFVGAVWPTLYTGTSPGHHGRWWPGRLHPGTYQIRPFEPSAIGIEPLWLALARAGRRVAVIDAPHGPTGTDAGLTQLTDWGGHEPSPAGFQASSPALADDIRARFGSHPIDDCDRYGATGQLEQLVRDMRTGVERKTELTCSLLDQADWDLFFSVFTEAHCAGHQCWHLHDADHPRHDAAQAGILGDPLVDVYRRLDGALGEVLARAGDDSEVFVLLSHGMGPHYDATFMVTEILRRLESMWNREASTWATARDRCAHAWNRIARRAGLRPRGTWVLDGSRPFFRAPNAGLCAAVRINLIGREPAGTVAPGPEYDDLCSALSAEFLSLRNVETGEPAANRVLRSAEIYDGPYVGQMPDLLVEWRQEHPIRAVASPTIGKVEGAYTGHRTGDHRRDGLLLRRGPTASANATTTIDGREFAPTVHALLEVPFAYTASQTRRR